MTYHTRIVDRMKSIKVRKTIPWTEYICVFVVAIILSSCSMLMPDRSAPKSAKYDITPPSTPWRSVPVGEDPDSVEALRADIAYENPETGAIISLNSICRKYWELTLDDMSRNLVLGIKNNKEMSSKYLSIDGGEAKDTTHHGIVDDTSVKIRTVVIKKNSCTYDFIYVAKLQESNSSEDDFEAFLGSFAAE